MPELYQPILLSIIDVAQLIQSLLLKFTGVIPSLLAAILVFFIGYFIANAVGRILKIAIESIGIDKLAAKLGDIDIVQKSKIDIKPSVFLSKMVSYILLLVFTIAATDLLGMPAISQLMADLINYIPNLFSALILMAIGVFFADSVKKMVVTTCQSLGISAAKMIGQVVFFFLFITIAVSAMAQAKIDTAFISSNLTVLLGAGAAAFAFGYGLASRDLLSNFLAGYYSKQKIRRGDVIRIDGVKGEVVATDSSTMTLWTGEHHVVIPMSKLTTEKLEIFHGAPMPGVSRIEEKKAE
jgi:small-conductance mechanosensitive channel